MAMSVAQRRLSSRGARAAPAHARGERYAHARDGSTEQLTIGGLLRPLDGALAALSLAIVLTACALIIARL